MPADRQYDIIRLDPSCMSEASKTKTQDGLAHLAELRAAAENGDAPSQHRLAHILLQANTENEVLEGFHWLEKAALKQHPLAVHSLATLLINNPKVDTFNRSVALYLLESIGITGKLEIDMLSTLGELLFGKFALSFGYLLIQTDPSCGLAALKSAATQGSTLAMCLLAQFHLAEQYGKTDQTKALALFTEAAEMGDFQAQERLATIYTFGEICAPNPALAAHWSAEANVTRKNWQSPYDAQTANANRRIAAKAARAKRKREAT